MSSTFSPAKAGFYPWSSIFWIGPWSSYSANWPRKCELIDDEVCTKGPRSAFQKEEVVNCMTSKMFLYGSKCCINVHSLDWKEDLQQPKRPLRLNLWRCTTSPKDNMGAWMMSRNTTLLQTQRKSQLLELPNSQPVDCAQPPWTSVQKQQLCNGLPHCCHYHYEFSLNVNWGVMLLIFALTILLLTTSLDCPGPAPWGRIGVDVVQRACVPIYYFITYGPDLKI